MTRFMTTLEKIQADHQKTLDPRSAMKEHGKVPSTPPDIIALLLQEILDTVRRTEALLREETKYGKKMFSTFDTKKSTKEKPIGIEDKR